jgi:hypothetical protein
VPPRLPFEGLTTIGEVRDLPVDQRVQLLITLTLEAAITNKPAMAIVDAHERPVRVRLDGKVGLGPAAQLLVIRSKQVGCTVHTLQREAVG